MDKNEKENFQKENLELLLHFLKDFQQRSTLKFELSKDKLKNQKVLDLLNGIEGLELDRETQNKILYFFPDFLPRISNLTLETILKFCDSSVKPYDGFESEALLFECYKKNIEFFKEFNIEDKSQMITKIIIVTKEETIFNMYSPEAVQIYNSIIDFAQNLTIEQKKEILAQKPEFIKHLKDQPEELQILAIEAAINGSYYAIADTFLGIKNPTDEAYALMLELYHYDTKTIFGDKFKDGVPDRIIDLIIGNEKTNSSKVFVCQPRFGKEELNDAQIDALLKRDPLNIGKLTAEELTVDRILEAIKAKPSVIMIIAEEFGIYSDLYARYAEKMLSIENNNTEGNISAVKKYRQSIDKILNAYYALLSFDNDLEAKNPILSRFKWGIYDKGIYRRTWHS